MDEGDIRIFTCVKPDAPSLVALAPFAERLSAIRGYKWVRPEQMHVTLLFLGEVPPTRIAALDSELGRIGGVRPFDISVSGAGAFSTLERPRVIWLGVRAGARELERLWSSVARAARAAGIEMQGGRFRAHLTIGRSRSRDGEPMTAELAAALEEAPSVSWRCSSFALMRSTLTPKGPIYSPLGEYEL